MVKDRLWLQVRASALAGFASAVHVLLCAALMIPLRLGLDLLLARATEGDLKLPVVLASSFAAAWFFATFTSTFLDLRRQDRIGAARNPSFPATAFVAGLYGRATIGSLCLIIGLHQQREPLWMQVLPVTFVVLFFAWPRTIYCSEHCISQRNLWGSSDPLPMAQSRQSQSTTAEQPRC